MTLTTRQRMERAVPESAWQQQVIDLAHTLGWKAAHFRTVRIQRRNGQTYHATPVAADGVGFPDLILVRGSRIIAVELKRELGRVRDEQVEWLDWLDHAGCETYVWRPSDWDDVERTLTGWES